MRLSRFPRGTCTAPGRWPSCHSSISRTSIHAAPSIACAPRASTSEISALVRASSSRYVVMTSITVACPGRIPKPATFVGVTPALRVRLLVAVAVTVAAGIVVGVVYATRQDPPQPTAQCKKPPAPIVLPGVQSDHVAEVRAAFRNPPRAAARSLEDLAQRNPGDPVV